MNIIERISNTNSRSAITVPKNHTKMLLIHCLSGDISKIRELIMINSINEPKAQEQQILSGKGYNQWTK